MPPQQRETGFTILELMIAATVFSVILLIVAIGVISFTNSYYKGVAASKTQATARDIMAAVTQSIQFGKDVNTVSGSGNVRGVCVDSTLYAYVPGQQVTDSNINPGKHQGYHGLAQQTGQNCTAGVPNALASALGSPGVANLNGSRELLGPHMRVDKFTVSGNGDVFTVHLRLIYGDDDVLTPTVTGSTNWDTSNEQCVANQLGGQFCAVSDLTTTVERRLTL